MFAPSLRRVLIWLLIAMWPGNASCPTAGKPRVPEARSTPGPYRMMLTSNPLRTRRVEVSRFTRATEIARRPPEGAAPGPAPPCWWAPGLAVAARHHLDGEAAQLPR